MVGAAPLYELVVDPAVPARVVHAEPEGSDEGVLVGGNEVPELLHAREDGRGAEVGELGGGGDGRLENEQTVRREVNPVWCV